MSSIRPAQLIFPCLILGMAGALPTLAVYKPTAEATAALKGAEKLTLQQVLNKMRLLPKDTREAMLACRFGLLYMTDGTEPADSDQEIAQGAKYVGSDGKERDWQEACRRADARKLAEAQQLCSSLPDALIGAAYAKEITKLVHRCARHTLRSMPPPVRFAWLAQAADLLYLPNGRPAPAADLCFESYSGARISDRMADPALSLYAGADGEEYNGENLAAQEATWAARARLLHVCSRLVGKAEILSLCQEELAAMRRACAQAKATRAEQYAHDARMQLDALAPLPPDAQQALIAARLGLCYMTDGSSAYAERHWQAPLAGARFIASDGRSLDYHATLRTAGEQACSAAAEQLEEARLSGASFPAEQTDAVSIALKTARLHLESMPTLLRDDCLAEIGGFMFLPGGKSAYTGKHADLITDSGLLLRLPESDTQQATFVDSLGRHYKRHSSSAIGEKWERARTILRVCERLAGADALLALYPEAAEALRRHYNEATHTSAMGSGHAF